MLAQVPSLGEEKDRLKLEVTLAGADGRQWQFNFNSINFENSID